MLLNNILKNKPEDPLRWAVVTIKSSNPCPNSLVKQALETSEIGLSYLDFYV